MRSIAGKLYQRFSLFSLSIVLAVSSLSAIAPLFLSQAANAVSPADVVVNGTTHAQYSTIQAAVTAANVGDTVEIGAGTYTEAVTINTPLTLIGDPGATLVVNTTTVNGITVNADNVSISGLTITGPAVGVSYTAFSWGNDVTRGIVVSQGVAGFSISSNTLTSLRNDLLIDGRNNTGSVTANTIDNSKSGISVQYTDATGITISGNTQGTFGNDWGVNLHLNGHFVGNTAYSTSQKIATISPSAAQDTILANSSANNGWTVQDQGYALSNRTAVTVSTTGASSTAQGDPLGPISTVQGGLNAITKNGIVNVKNGIYTEGSSNPADGLTFTNPGTRLVGESEAGTVIVPVSNEYGYGLTSERVGDVTISNLTVNGTSTSGGSALKFHNFSGLTLSNIDVTGISTPRATGIDINSVSNVSLNNVNVTGFGKNGIAVTAKYATTDTLTQNVAFNNVTSNHNSWAGLAFYTSNNAGTVPGNINGVTFTGANQLENNGEGLFIEGDTDANHITHNTPRYTVSGASNAPVDLGNTTFSGNTLDIDNYQTNSINALSVVFGTKIGNEMFANEQATENNLIIDQRDYSTFGLVNYYTTTATLAAPTNLRFQFQYDAAPLTSNYLNVTAKSGGNNLELLWDAPTGTVAGYHIYETYPNGDAAPSPAYQGSNTNAWLNGNGFGQHGQGAYTYEIAAVDSAGQEGTRSTIATLYYDTVAPVVSVTPVAGSLLDGIETFHITVTDANLNPSILKHIYVYLYNNNPPQKLQGASVDLSSGSADFTVDTTNLVDGLATFNVGKLYDAVGNASGTSDSYFKNYTIDNTAPAVPTLLSPANGVYRKTADTNSSSWSTVTDPSGPVTYYYESAFDSAFKNIAYGPHAQTTTSILNPGEPEGTYYWRVTACDSLANCSAWSSPWTINIDNTAPTGLANLSPFDGAYVTTASLASVDWTDASDSSAPISYYYESSHSSAVNSDGSFVSPVYQSGALSSSMTPALNTLGGVYYWNVRAADPAGNSTAWTAPWKITVDNTAPSSTNDLATLVHGTVTIHQSISDNFAPKSGKLRIWKLTSGGVADNSKFFAIGDVAVDGTNSVTYNLDTVANLFGDGNYIAKFTSTDQAGNTSVSQVNFTVDNTAPVVTIDTLALTKNNEPTFTGTIDDTTATIALKIDGTDYAAINNGHGTWTYIVTSPLSDGSYTLSATATDTAGNTTSPVASSNVTVDTIAPVVTIPTYSTNGNIITPTVTATDLNSPLTYTWAANDSASGTNVTISDTSALEPDFTVNADGTYNFTLTATDPAGNPSSQTFTFTHVTPTTPAAPAANVPVSNTPTTGTGFTNVTTAPTNQGVLGDSTTTPNNTAADNSGTPAVLGTSTDKSSTPWSLAWYWWVLIVAAVVSFVWWLIARLRNRANVA
jgi:hypothetical protein